MYSLYRRHEPKTETAPGCRYANKGVRHIKCDCPVWMEGRDENGKRQRRSLKTRSWSQAQARLNEFETGVVPVALAAPASPTLAAAITSFLDDCRARNLAARSLSAYANSLEHLSNHFPGRRLEHLNLEAMTGFRAARSKSAATTARNEIGTIRSFFHFCEDREWITKNPAKRLRLPKSNRLPTMPFSDEEIGQLIAACDQIIDTRGELEQTRTRIRARALILTLLYSGLRISDTIQLKRASLDMGTGRLLIRMMKTGEPLYVRLPADALAALAALPAESDYFFWNGKSELYSAVRTGARTIERLLVSADVKHGHPHRFRDTFSVSLLRNGVDLRTVQLLLGHTSIQTTEKHYAPYVASMQRALDEAVSTLHFGSAPQPQPPVNAQHNAQRDRKANVLTFARTKRRA